MSLLYLKMVFRNYWNNKLFSIVNCIGLSVSIVVTILLFIYISTEKGVDKFHKNSENIYRVLRNNECAFSPPFGQYIVDNIPGAEAYCRIFVLEATLKSDYNILTSPNFYYADSNFFQMFSFSLKSGNPLKVLESPNNIVLSESYAEKLFPNQDPIGKQLRFNNRLDYFVTGVFKDFKENTHFNQADAIFSYAAFADFLGNGVKGFLNQYDLKYFMPALYIKAKDKTDLSHAGELLYKKAKSWYWLFQEEESEKTTFQPLTEAYLHPATYAFTSGAREGNNRLITFLTFIVIGILTIAIVNFINLTVAYSTKRTNEVGIKEIFGAYKSQIAVQSLLETTLLFISSFLLALFFLMLSLPLFSELTGYHADLISLVTTVQWKYITLILVAFWGGSVILPALILSNFSLKLRKNVFSSNLKFIQQTLVALQFTISIVLLISMTVILKQNHFLRNYNIGFNKEESLYIKLNSDIKNHKLLFKEKLEKIAGVKAVSLCNGMPGEGIFNIRFEANNKTQNMDILNVDSSYFEVMGIRLKNKILPGSDICWITKTAASSLGYKPADRFIEIEEYGTKTRYWVNEILPDMNFHSLYEKTRPTIFTKINTDEWVDYAFLRINTSDTKEVLAAIEKEFKSISSNFPFDFAFLNDVINKAYQKEARFSKVVLWFSVFAILISSFGIFTLTVFSSNKRTKEIGIRRVNGARTGEVIAMLNRDFLKWVAIAFLIACPIAWYAMHKWLENFAYKTDLSWWVFVAAGAIAMLIALVTVSWQSWRAATRNPVESLRYE